VPFAILFPLATPGPITKITRMRYLLFLFIYFTLFACHKSKIEPGMTYSEAAYKMQVSMNWTSPQFSVPPNAHVTSLIGMVHRKDTFLWKENFQATPGLEDVAEVGNTTKMNSEIDAVISSMKANGKFQLPSPSLTGITETTLQLSTVFSSVSFASMLAPSPDWFLGISNISLIKDNRWVDSLMIQVKVYDAGTEDGDVFSYNNLSSSPQQPIKILTAANGSALANGNTSIASIATVRFIKL
jgi:hypothetical protein